MAVMESPTDRLEVLYEASWVPKALKLLFIQHMTCRYLSNDALLVLF